LPQGRLRWTEEEGKFEIEEIKEEGERRRELRRRTIKESDMFFRSQQTSSRQLEECIGCELSIENDQRMKRWWWDLNEELKEEPTNSFLSLSHTG